MDSRCGPYHGPVAYVHVIFNSNLSAYNNFFAYMDTAGYSGLGHYYRIISNRHIMGDLYLIIGFDPPLNPGFPAGGTVYGCIGTYLNLVINDDDSQLRHLDIFSPIAHKPEAVTAYDTTRVNNDVVSYNAALKNSNVRI